MSQWDKDDLERLGFLKFDILVVTALDVLNECESYIRTRSDPDFDIYKLPMDDPAVYDMICQGRTKGSFQLGTGGFIPVCQTVQPKDIETLIALVALFRPGSKDYIDVYAKNKSSGRVQYMLPELEPILAETYGVIVYQEQSMKIVSELGGFSLAEADMIRRSISKVKGDFAKFAKPFLDGCVRNGIDRTKAEELFQILRKSEDYAFNKAHACAYAVLAYWTMWLKTYWPAVFMAALLTKEKDPDMVGSFVRDSRSMGLGLSYPDINGPVWCSPESEGESIRIGIAMIRGLGEGAALEIAKAQPYKSLQDFWTRTDRKTVRTGTLISLIQAHAFDELEGSREQVLSSLTTILKMKKRATFKADPQFDYDKLGMFDAGAFQSIFLPQPVPKEKPEPKGDTKKEKSVAELIEQARNGDDIDLFGFRLSPVRVPGTVATTNIQDLDPNENPDKSFFLAVTVTSSRTIQKRSTMVFLELSDNSGSATFVLFEDDIRFCGIPTVGSDILVSVSKAKNFDVYKIRTLRPLEAIA